MNIKLASGFAILIILGFVTYWILRAPGSTPAVAQPEPISSVSEPAVASTSSTVAPAIQSQSFIDNEVVLHGKAMKGVIMNARIRATEIVDGKPNGAGKEVEIDSSGEYSVSMPIGVILLQLIPRKGTIEKDEVLAVDVPLPLDFSFRAAIDLKDETRKTIEVNITAYSEAAVSLALKNGGLSARNVNRANSGIMDILGVDFLGTEMIQSNDSVRLAGATPAEKKMAILNAAMSEMASKDKMGCGVRPTYGDTINCTIANFAAQFSASNW